MTNCLTNTEMNALCTIGCMEASGRYLISGRPIQQAVQDMIKELTEARDAETAGNTTDRQSCILEFYKQCSDYDYYMSRPVTERLF